MEPEETAIRRLEASDFNVDFDTVEELRQCFQRLRELESTINPVSPRCLYEGQWAMLGLIARGYSLSLCCIEMLAEGNWNGFYARARGLLETICTAAWALQNVERLPSLVRQEQVTSGKMLNAGYSKWPYLKELYSELSTIVHAARAGYLLGFSSGGLEETGIMTSFSDHFFNRKLNTLRTLLLGLVAEIRELVSMKEDSIRAGTVMAELRPRMED